MRPLARPCSKIRCVLAMVAGLTTCAISLAATLPGSMQGKWEVTQVAVDGRDQPHWQYFPDDPRLLGRQVVVTDASVSINDDSRDCQAAVSKPLPSSRLQTFIGERLPRPESMDTPTQPTLADFHLKLSDAAVSPFSTACTPDTSAWNGAWWIQLSPDQILTNYDNSGYVLVLQRRVDGASVKPSFNCSKAAGEVEQTICASAALAGYDRSVTAAYHRAMGTSDDKASLKQEQVDWIKTRNGCAKDVACLQKSMHDRVDQLMQQ